MRAGPSDFDTAVVGAGVVGLAVARRLAQSGRKVILLERHPAPGTETSSRNSEVIHAGLYYPPGSHRARLCVAGRAALYAYCNARGIQAPRLGKLVVATNPAEEAALQAIAARAAENGVTAARLVTGGQARALEPALRCTAALLSPDTGILDSHAYMLALQADAAAADALLAARTEILAVHCENPGFTLVAADGTRLRAAGVVNAAGLGAVALAHRTEGLAARHIPPAFLSKGSYFALSGASPFRHLVYPVPIPGGAGVHLTLDLAGRARFGPDVEPVDRIDYAVDPARADAFYGAIRRYWPALPDGALTPAYAGIRPKIVPAAQSQDFIIQGPAIHAIPGLVNLFGIESPGLTASLAIADDVAACLATAAA